MKKVLQSIGDVLRRAVEKEPALLIALIVAAGNAAFSLTIQQEALGQAVVESLVYAAFPAAVRPMVYSPASVEKIKNKKLPKSGIEPL